MRSRWITAHLPGLTAALLWLLPLIFLGCFFFFPLMRIFSMALGEPAPENWRLVAAPLGFTLWQAGLSTLATLLVGLPAAYLFARFNFAGKSLLRVLSAVPFILPTVVVAAGINALLGPRGWVNVGLMQLFHLESPPIQFLNTLWAIIAAHVFYNTTIVIRLVGSAWAQLDPRLEHAGRVLGASALRTAWEITLPLLRPAITAAALLVFLFDFTSFGVVLLLGGPRFATLEVEIYTQAMSMLNLPAAALLSMVQLGSTLLLTVLYQRASGGRIVPLIPRLKGEAQRAARTPGERLFVAAMASLLVLLLVSPLAALAARSVARLEAERGQREQITAGVTLDYYAELFTNRRGSLFYVPPAEAVKNSLGYAVVTVVIALLLGSLAALALNRRRARWLDALLMLPLGASAVTLGLGFVVVFNRPPLQAASFPLLLPIAHSLVALPFVVRTMQPAMASIPENLRNAARMLGANPRQVWREVDAPILARAALVSGIFAFTISLGEFGATSFLALPDRPTIPIAIYRFLSQPGALNYGQALAMAVLLMVICGLSVALIDRLEG